MVNLCWYRSKKKWLSADIWYLYPPFKGLIVWTTPFKERKKNSRYIHGSPCHPLVYWTHYPLVLLKHHSFHTTTIKVTLVFSPIFREIAWFETDRNPTMAQCPNFLCDGKTAMLSRPQVSCSSHSHSQDCLQITTTPAYFSINCISNKYCQIEFWPQATRCI